MQVESCSFTSSADRYGPFGSPPPGRGLFSLIEMLRTWRQRARSRSELAAADDATLQDLGWSRSQAMFEAAKPFWRG